MEHEAALSRLDSSIGLGAEEEGFDGGDGGPVFDASAGSMRRSGIEEEEEDEDNVEDDPIVAALPSRGETIDVWGGVGGMVVGGMSDQAHRICMHCFDRRPPSLLLTPAQTLHPISTSRRRRGGCRRGRDERVAGPILRHVDE